MASKRLAIHEIEDDEDTKNRIIERQARKKQKVKLSFADDEEDGLESPVILSKKVKLIESKLQSISGVSPNPTKGDCENISNVLNPNVDRKTSPNDQIFEDSPTVVESASLQSESSVDSIPNIINIAKVLVKYYEQLSLHFLYDTAEENCKFRLFLYAISFCQAQLWPKEAVMVNVLKRILTSENVSRLLISNGIEMEKVAGEKETLAHRRDGACENIRWPSQEGQLHTENSVVRYCKPIQIPHKVTRLLP